MNAHLSKPVEMKVLEKTIRSIKSGGGGYRTAGQIKVASDVDWNGVIMKVYIWMEGTDSDCIASVVDGDEAEYDVTVHLVGLSS